MEIKRYELIICTIFIVNKESYISEILYIVSNIKTYLEEHWRLNMYLIVLLSKWTVDIQFTWTYCILWQMKYFKAFRMIIPRSAWTLISEQMKQLLTASCVCEELPEPSSTEEADGDKLRPLCWWGRDAPRPLAGGWGGWHQGGGAGRTVLTGSRTLWGAERGSEVCCGSGSSWDDGLVDVHPQLPHEWDQRSPALWDTNTRDGYFWTQLHNLYIVVLNLASNDGIPLLILL